MRREGAGPSKGNGRGSGREGGHELKGKEKKKGRQPPGPMFLKVWCNGKEEAKPSKKGGKRRERGRGDCANGTKGYLHVLGKGKGNQKVELKGKG